jgi:hypothetical protein
MGAWENIATDPHEGSPAAIALAIAGANVRLDLDGQRKEANRVLAPVHLEQAIPSPLHIF